MASRSILHSLPVVLSFQLPAQQPLVHPSSCFTNASSRTRPARQRQASISSIGVGGMGASDLASLSSHPAVEVVALCDVDETRLNDASKLHPNAKLFRDYRVMLREMGSSIDAVERFHA